MASLSRWNSRTNGSSMYSEEKIYIGHFYFRELISSNVNYYLVSLSLCRLA